jgi:uncharacterized protein YbjQ (UPF0145 family)
VEALLQLLIFGGLLSLGVFGFYRERAHLADLDEREATMQLPTSTLHAPIPAIVVTNATMVTGNVVQAADYLKTFLFTFVALFGGESQSLGRVLVRARREALLRAQEEAMAFGARALVNVRFETSTMGQKQGNRRIAATEVVCHGTAVR